MSVAIYIVCESDIGGLENEIDGKSIGHVSDEVFDRISTELSIQSLYDFMSFDAGEMGDFGDDLGVDAADAETQWFSPKDALDVVRGMIGYFQANPPISANIDAIVEDLRGFERVLEVCEQQNVRFHFAVDI